MFLFCSLPSLISAVRTLLTKFYFFLFISSPYIPVLGGSSPFISGHCRVSIVSNSTLFHHDFLQSGLLVCKPFSFGDAGERRVCPQALCRSCQILAGKIAYSGYKAMGRMGSSYELSRVQPGLNSAHSTSPSEHVHMEWDVY